MDIVKMILMHLVVIGGFVVVGAMAVVTARVIRRKGTRFLPKTSIVILLLLAGCGQTNGRLAVVGEVSLDGKAVQSGSILFVPETRGPKVGTKIKNGHFQFTNDNGPLTGSYRVEIFADEQDAIPLDDPLSFTKQMEESPERIVPSNSIPEVFNRRSQLTASPSPGNLQINFNLQSSIE